MARRTLSPRSSSRTSLPLVSLVAVVSASFSPVPALAASTRIATNLNRPVIAVSPPGDDRIFIVEQAGVIEVWKNGLVLPTHFLDIQSKVVCCALQGMLGLAFHPDYATNGYFYVNYTNLAGDTVIERYSVSANPDVANPASAHQIYFVDQPHVDHNGGSLVFGPDGYLYIGMGDGGVPNDPLNVAQNPASPLGKLLRIDVDGGDPYSIPPDNPFVGLPGYLPEIWARGLRNPWILHFDSATDDLWIADVGQSKREEVDFQPAGSPGGENYGWRLMEGSICFNPPADCNDGTLTLPIHEYPHNEQRCSIEGGAVYRGTLAPYYTGAYFFSDFCNNHVWTLRQVNGVVTEVIDRTTDLAPVGGGTITSMASVCSVQGGEIVLIDRGAGGGDGEVFLVSSDPVDVAPVSGPPGLQVFPNPTTGTFAIAYAGDPTLPTVIAVFDAGGRLVRQLESPAKNARVEWDGRDQVGRPVPGGAYLIRATSGEQTVARVAIRLR
ncbi:MAG: PQQ-dependent sugar dehydrogenase [Candidatus Eisenbacteria bacterium]|nr:PQQ-dependent sugar dehydrogenase [Candidatus Eisenbacteria bacterium]